MARLSPRLGSSLRTVTQRLEVVTKGIASERITVEIV